MNDLLHFLGAIALAALTLGFAAFCFLFHVLADWRATVMGRHVMTFMGSITVILLFYWVDLAFDIPAWVCASIQVPLFAFMAIVVWRRVALLIKIQKQARSQPVQHFWSKEDE